ncbi:MAG: nucleotide exchange factor GrpE [Prochloraceae cyanobacterium]|nr:nucleotide exchange factor GrpE [Prochloraceae cyanobacterium]
MIEDQKQPQDTSDNLEEIPELSDRPSDSNSVVQETPSPEESTTENNLPKEELQELHQQIATLTEQLEKQTKQGDNFKGQYIRMAADFENLQKRTIKEKEELEYQVKRKTINELLAVVDNFERARSQIKPSNDGEMAIHKAYQGVYKNFVDGLKKLGVSAMRPEGQPFDPNMHEAMFQEETSEYPEGTVIDQLVRGYMLGDRILRHAMVKVATAPEGVITSEEESSQEELASNQDN